MNINFNTDNAVIVAYPPGAGGRFLINLLGLSDRAVFQHAKLAEQQLYSEFTPEDKFQYLKSQTNCQTWWNELYLGDGSLFGLGYSPTDAKTTVTEPIIEQLSTGPYKFFMTTNCDYHTFKELITVWPNAKIIYFTNFFKFIKFRFNDADVRDVYTAPAQLFNQLLDEYNSIKSLYNVITWNTDNYFSVDQTINDLKNLYDLLDLGQVNEYMCKHYYEAWFSKVVEFRVDWKNKYWPQTRTIL